MGRNRTTTSFRQFCLQAWVVYPVCAADMTASPVYITGSVFDFLVSEAFYTYRHRLCSLPAMTYLEIGNGCFYSSL